MGNHAASITATEYNITPFALVTQLFQVCCSYSYSSRQLPTQTTGVNCGDPPIVEDRTPTALQQKRADSAVRAMAHRDPKTQSGSQRDCPAIQTLDRRSPAPLYRWLTCPMAARNGRADGCSKQKIRKNKINIHFNKRRSGSATQHSRAKYATPVRHAPEKTDHQASCIDGGGVGTPFCASALHENPSGSMTPSALGWRPTRRNQCRPAALGWGQTARRSQHGIASTLINQYRVDRIDQ